MSLEERRELIRVLIVEDSSFIAQVLSRILNQCHDIEVVGIATDGEKAVEMAEKLRPDLITMDIHLPRMNGYEATKQIMAYFPTPILVVSSAEHNQMNMTFSAIDFGALDMIEKGKLESGGDQDFEVQLVEKVRFLSRVKVITHPMARLERVGFKNFSKKETNGEHLEVFIVGIAGSTGSPHVVLKILKNLPRKIEFCILIVQHIIPSFTEGFVEWLSSESLREVRTAMPGDLLEPGKIFVAPGNAHLKISPKGRIVISHAPPYKGHRPSANVMFQSIAEVAGSHAVGVILSGMGSDGLEGLTEMHKKRVPIIAQDERSCVVYGMPKECVDAGIVTSIASMENLAREIMNFVPLFSG